MPLTSKILHSYHHRPSLFSASSSRRVSFDEESALLPSAATQFESNSRVVNLAIFINFAANVFLLAAKFIVALSSSSLSVLASLVDSALDFMSTLIIYTVSRIIQSKDWRSHYQFPVGRARLEPIGVLVFSVIMIVSFIQVGVEAVQRLIRDGETHEVVVLSTQSIVIMASTGKNSERYWLRIVVVKFGCWLWSRSVKNSGVQALSQDAMNDVVFKSISSMILLTIVSSLSYFP
jgi:divalent metal cation (Fe/Co/Zn/Cd) transporter